MSNMPSVRHRIFRFVLWSVLFVTIGATVLFGGFLGWGLNQSMIHVKENDTRNTIHGLMVAMVFALPVVGLIVAKIIRSYRE